MLVAVSTTPFRALSFFGGLIFINKGKEDASIYFSEGHFDIGCGVDVNLMVKEELPYSANNQPDWGIYISLTEAAATLAK